MNFYAHITNIILGLWLCQIPMVNAAEIIRSKSLIIESIHIKGSDRLPSDFLENELKIKANVPLTKELLQDLQLKLYGLGLFESVILGIEKSEQQGHIKLNIDLRDDPSVVGSWAVGGTLSISKGEATTSAIGSESSPMGIRTEIIARNILTRLHRGRIEVDMDGQGIYRGISASYGFPRFSKEGVQFDSSIQVNDVRKRYMEGMGFGGRGSALWSYEAGAGTFQYGLGMFTNRLPRFGYPGFPSSIVAPQFSYEQETRLRQFFPTEGHRYKITLMPAGSSNKTIYRAQLSYSKVIPFSILTLDGQYQGIGRKGNSHRLSAQLDIPLGSRRSEGGLFAKYQWGQDRYEDSKFWGRSINIGLRYHSFGLIAELAFKIVREPQISTSLDSGDGL